MERGTWVEESHKDAWGHDARNLVGDDLTDDRGTEMGLPLKMHTHRWNEIAYPDKGISTW
jgi:hypothetical protein